MKYITRGSMIFLFREVGLSECAFQKMPPKIFGECRKIFLNVRTENRELWRTRVVVHKCVLGYQTLADFSTKIEVFTRFVRRKISFLIISEFVKNRIQLPNTVNNNR